MNLFFLISLLLAAAPAPKLSNMLNELFGIKHNPSIGEFTFTHGSSTEKVTFNSAGGLYAIGFALPSELMPEPYRHQFKGTQAIHVLFGNASPVSTVSQFGSLLFFVDSLGKSAKLKVRSHGSAEQTRTPNAFFAQFRSPTTPATTTDEDRLKGTFFASQGGAKLSPKGIALNVVAAFTDRRLRFSKRRIELEIDSKMATPFNPEAASLKGSLAFTVFSPGGDDTRAVLKELLHETLRSPLAPSSSRALTGK